MLYSYKTVDPARPSLWNGASYSGVLLNSQGSPPVSATTVANFSTIFASVVDTGSIFATSVNDAGGK
jgi:hypothetical protein